jgi:hypothetical protein
LSCDPLGSIAGLNCYSFASCNPTTFIDFEGKQTADPGITSSSVQADKVDSVSRTSDSSNIAKEPIFIQEQADPYIVTAKPVDKGWISNSFQFASDLMTGLIRGAVQPMLEITGAGHFADYIFPERSESKAYSVGKALSEIVWGFGGILAGLGGGGTTTGMMILSDGSLVPVLTPALVWSASLATLGSTMVMKGGSDLNNAFAKKAAEAPEGGAHGDVKKGSQQGVFESNHSPPKSISPLPPEVSPAHKMKFFDHRGYDTTKSQLFRDTLNNILTQRGFRESQLADMQRIIDKFGPEKYKFALYQMQLCTKEYALSNPGLIKW